MVLPIWFVTALGTVAAWSLGTLLSKPATTRLGPRLMLLLTGAEEAGLYLALFVLLRTAGASWDPWVIVSAILAGVTGTLGYVFYYNGIREGTVGFMGTMTAAYPAPTILLALFLLHETLTIGQAAGVLLLLTCVILLALEPRAQRTTSRAAMAFGLAAFISWGLWGYFAKVAVDALGGGNLFAFYSVTNVGVIGGFLVATRTRATPAPPRTRSGLALGIGEVLCGAAGVIFLTFAYAEGPASLVSAVTAAYPLFSTLAAHFLLKERFGWREAASLAIFLPGILLVAF